MRLVNTTNLACPLDGLPLLGNDRQLACVNRHSFDIARQGYINLLPVQFKHSKQPGDSAAMIEARTAFLATNHYAPIAEQIAEITKTILADCHEQQSTLLDAGCGEGYYLTQLANALQPDPSARQVALIGLDISKPAILAASKRSRQITWLIATSSQPPILPASIDIIYCMFGYPMFEQFNRLLKPGGKILLVDAGPDHLIELRKLIYAEVKQSPPPDLSAALASGFNLHEESRLTYTAQLDSTASIMNLFMMTPHYFRASQAARARVEELTNLTITIDAVFRVLVAG